MKSSILSALLCLSGAISYAQTDSLKQEVESIKEEIRRMRLENAIPEIELKSYSGLGPAASKVYYSPKGLSIAGYGDLVYENFLSDSKTDRGDAVRLVPYIAYKFSDKIIANTEIEIEHAGIKDVNARVPEVYAEFMYVDFLLHKNINVRTGLILLPISYMNEFHEPTVYFGTLRPDVERNIIPTVWRDLGLMIYGDIAAGITYKAALVNGMRTDGVKDWIGNGRQRGAEANFDNVAGVFRLNYGGVKGLNIGASAYYGSGSEGKGAVERKAQWAQYFMTTADINYQWNGVSLKALYSFGNAHGDSLYESKAGRSKEVEGWYGEIGYNLVPLISSKSDMSFSPYVRYEDYNLNKSVFTGTVNTSSDRTVLTAGFDFKPHPQVVLKADYSARNSASDLPEGKKAGQDENKIDQINIALGFIF